jgi:hypothetical protein
MKNAILSSIFFVLLGCEGFKDDELSMQRTDYLGNELKINGFYYTQKDNNFQLLQCFYRNGVILKIPGIQSSNLQDAENYIIRRCLENNEYKKHGDSWGVFEIKNNYIRFEHFVGFHFSYLVYTYEGMINNDTTFTIIRSYRVDGSEMKYLNEVYHFHQFSPKPDSTNKWIK